MDLERCDLKGCSFKGEVEGEIGQESRGVKTLINAGMETCFSFVQIGIRLARDYIVGN